MVERYRQDNDHHEQHDWKRDPNMSSRQGGAQSGSAWRGQSEQQAQDFGNQPAYGEKGQRFENQSFGRREHESQSGRYSQQNEASGGYGSPSGYASGGSGQRGQGYGQQSGYGASGSQSGYGPGSQDYGQRQFGSTGGDQSSQDYSRGSYGAPTGQSGGFSTPGSYGTQSMSGRFDDQGSGQQRSYDSQSGSYGGQAYGQRQQSSFSSPGAQSGGYSSQGGFGSQGGYGPATYGAQGGYGQHGGDHWPQSAWGQQNRQQRRGPKGYKRSDERIKEDLCERLMHSSHLDAGEVSVEVKDGKVTLEGTVPERRMKHAIEDMAEACSGVNDVENKLRVSRSGAQDSSIGNSSQSGTPGSSASTSGKSK